MKGICNSSVTQTIPKFRKKRKYFSNYEDNLTLKPENGSMRKYQVSLTHRDVEIVNKILEK